MDVAMVGWYGNGAGDGGKEAAGFDGGLVLIHRRGGT